MSWKRKEMTKRFAERFFMELSFMLPKHLVYWCAIRVWAHATTGKYGNTDKDRLTVQAAVERWVMDTPKLRRKARRTTTGKRRPRRARGSRPTAA